MSAPKMTLLPAMPGSCAMCTRDHEPELPHDLQSMFYGVRFKVKWGRDPTWADAAAHCTETVQAEWRRILEELGHKWTYPAEGDPIREPYAESQPFGDGCDLPAVCGNRDCVGGFVGDVICPDCHGLGRPQEFRTREGA